MSKPTPHADCPCGCHDPQDGPYVNQNEPCEGCNRPEGPTPQTFEEAMQHLHREVCDRNDICLDWVHEAYAVVEAAHQRDLAEAQAKPDPDCTAHEWRRQMEAHGYDNVAKVMDMLAEAREQGWLDRDTAGKDAEVAAYENGKRDGAEQARRETWREAAKRLQAYDFAAGNLAIDDPPKKGERRFSLAMQMAAEEFELRAKSPNNNT